MNPPYCGKLHLKILEIAIKQLKDENSICVNLSPIRWLQDPLAKYKRGSAYKKFEESVANHIESLNVINSKDGSDILNVGLTIQIGIYKCVKANSFNNCLSNKIIDKIYTNFIKDYNVAKHIKISEPNNFACVISLVRSGHGGILETRPSNWMIKKERAYFNNNKNYKGQTYKEYRDEICWGNVMPKSIITHIEFNSENERDNFYNTWKCNVIRYIYKTSMVDIHINPKFLPWLGDTINPRTSLKGYEGEWTDDDLYLLFEISPDEQKVIEEAVKKYIK